MIWIHGGAWLGGSNHHLFYGPEYLLDHDIVLVAINYRVGPLGFMSSETLDCPGNFGLKDQVEALRWVRQHISSFGGNPNSVTIFGESAGGASVGYLLQSDKSRGLFHKAIQQSGTIFNSWSYPLHKGAAQNRALKMARIFHCDNEEQDWKKIISCLKNVDGIELTRKAKEFVEWNGFPYFAFQPVVEPSHEQAFLDKRPREVSLNSLDIPILTGVTSGEGIISSSALLSKENLLNEVKSDFENKFPLMLSYDHWDKKKQSEITKALLDFYLKNGHDYSKLNHQNFTDMFSDSMFLSGFDEFLVKRLNEEAAPTYVYVFDFNSSSSLSKVVSGSDFNFGVCHGNDLPMFFPIHNIPFLGFEKCDNENCLILRNALTEMWVNFAVFGNPTPDNKWKPARKYPWNYAHLGGIDGNGFYVLKNEEGYANDRFNFWKDLKPHIENE
ncbi:CES5A.2 family protein [Megaselia abdita]